jgi:hypothetical protein
MNEQKTKDREARTTVLSVRKIELAARALECVQPEMPSLRGADMQEHATAKNQQRSAGRTNRGEYFGLGQVWNAGIRAETAGEGVTHG